MFRLAIALFIAVMLLPTDEVGDRTASIEVSTLEGLNAIKSVYDDLSGFCERNYETCVTGNALIGQAETKVRQSLGVLSSSIAENKPAKSDALLTGSIN